jgi:hypothetical protein
MFGLLRNRFAHNDIQPDLSDLDTAIANVNMCLWVVGDFFLEKRTELVHWPPAWRHKPRVDAADVRLPRYEEARQCCARCAVLRYWRGSEPSPSLLSFLGLWWVFAWGGAAGRLGIRRLLRGLGVMLQRPIPRKSRALYDTFFVACQNQGQLRLTCGASADWMRAGVCGI